MVKRLSAATALFIVFAFLSVSIAHACSGLALVGAAVQQSPMNMGGDNNSPCGKQKHDLCQSVRDSILSDQASISPTVSPHQMVLLIPFSFDTPIQFVFSSVDPVLGVAFHPVFKVPLTLSYLVLRI